MLTYLKTVPLTEGQSILILGAVGRKMNIYRMKMGLQGTGIHGYVLYVVWRGVSMWVKVGVGEVELEMGEGVAAWDGW